MSSKEIGGYFELERFYGPMLHQEAVALSCGRACIEYLFKQKNIKKAALPIFCCDVVAESCRTAGAELRFYNIGRDFKPLIEELQEDEWLYVVNFYGQLSNEYLKSLKEKFPRLIVDNAQAYFAPPVPGTDTIYTCRKFLGVPDGGFLYTDCPEFKPRRDQSFSRMNFLLGRFERTAGEFYAEASENNDYFSGKPIKSMSALTENLLRAIDYDMVKKRREDNFLYLRSALEDINLLNIHTVDGPYAYPLMLNNASQLRRELIDNKIFVPTLWPNVLQDAPKGSLEYELAANILPLPCDQRYGREDMDRIISFFK